MDKIICNKCGYSQNIDDLFLRRINTHINGINYENIKSIFHRLKCSECGSKNISITQIEIKVIKLAKKSSKKTKVKRIKRKNTEAGKQEDKILASMGPMNNVTRNLMKSYPRDNFMTEAQRKRLAQSMHSKRR